MGVNPVADEDEKKARFPGLFLRLRTVAQNSFDAFEKESRSAS